MNAVREFFSTYWPAIFSGILLSVSAVYEPYGSFFVFIAHIPLFVMLLGSKPLRQKIYAGCFTGCIYFSVVLFPLISVDVWWWLSPDTLWWKIRSILWTVCIALLSIYGSLSTYTLGAYLHTVLRRYTTTATFILIFPIAWVLIEALRTVSVFGFGWAHVGYNIINIPQIAHIAHWTGIHGLTYIIILTNVILAYCIYVYREQKKILATPLIILGIMYVVISTHGWFTMHTYESDVSTAEHISVALIPTTTQTEATTPEQYTEIFSQITTAASKGYQIIVLPENTFPLFVIDTATQKPIGYESAGTVASLFDTFLTITKTYATTSFVVGMHIKESGNRFNSLIVFTNGTIQDVYNKQKLLPIGERGNITPGPQDNDILIHNIHMYPRLCSEIMHGAKTGASLVIHVSNNGVFSNTSVEKYNARIARMQAIISGTSLIHSEKQGVSFITDMFGRITDASETNTVYTHVPVIY